MNHEKPPICVTVLLSEKQIRAWWHAACLGLQLGLRPGTLEMLQNGRAPQAASGEEFYSLPSSTGGLNTKMQRRR